MQRKIALDMLDLLCFRIIDGKSKIIVSKICSTGCNCPPKRRILLSSIRNACITDFCAVLENDDLTAALFEVTIGRIKKMRESNLLITLPCPVGTTVYMINENHAIVSGVIERFTVEYSGVLLAAIRMDNGITSFVHGKDFFLSAKDVESTMKALSY